MGQQQLRRYKIFMLAGIKLKMASRWDQPVGIYFLDKRQMLLKEDQVQKILLQ